jgi:hypothetical protein
MIKLELKIEQSKKQEKEQVIGEQAPDIQYEKPQNQNLPGTMVPVKKDEILK